MRRRRRDHQRRDAERHSAAQLVALLKKQFAIYERDAIVDWNFNPAPTIAEEIPLLAEQGIASFKIFMVVDTGRSYPHMPGIGVHDHGKHPGDHAGLRQGQRSADGASA